MKIHVDTSSRVSKLSVNFFGKLGLAFSRLILGNISQLIHPSELFKWINLRQSYHLFWCMQQFFRTE
jgi:hypothetical protein